jgi:hypothetical protein
LGSNRFLNLRKDVNTRIDEVGDARERMVELNKD